MAGAPLGNKNGARAALFRSALKRALSREHGDVRAGLERIATTLIKAALEGEGWAIGMVIDRIDGKPEQPIRGNVEHHHTVVAENADTLTSELNRILDTRAAVQAPARTVQ